MAKQTVMIADVAKELTQRRSLKHHLVKGAYAFLYGSPEAFLQNEKWRYLLRNKFSKQLTFAIVADENIVASTLIDPGQVGQKIPLLATRVETMERHTCLMIFIFIIYGVFFFIICGGYIIIRGYFFITFGT